MINEQEMLYNALSAHKAGDIKLARTMYEGIIDQSPENHEAEYFLGILCYETGDKQAAIEHMEKAALINPNREYIEDLSRILYESGEYSRSLEWIKKLSEPEIELLYKLGTAFGSMGEAQRAYECFEIVSKLLPDNPEVLYNLANSLQSLGKISEAKELYLKIIVIKPDFAQVYNNLGIIENSENNYEMAVLYYKKALEINPAYYSAYNNLGISYNECGELDKSIDCLNIALKNQSDNIDALNNLGKSLFDKGKNDAALDTYFKIISINPVFVSAYNNIGNIYRGQNSYDRAAEYYLKALELEPENTETINNLANLYYSCFKLDEASVYYHKTLELDPENPDAKFGLGTLFLLSGKFQEGWENYEYRFKVKDKKRAALPELKTPLWTGGESIEDKRVLVSQEQGFGDSIQFVRYLPLIKNLGAEVLFKADMGLEKLFQKSNLGVEIIHHSVPYEEINCSCYVPLMSLPRIFNAHPDNIPFKDSYLISDKVKTEFYKEKYFNNNDYKLGISWQGRNSHINDANRSVKLSDFKDIVSLKGIKTYSLQRGYGVEQLDNSNNSVNICSLGESFNDFADTAAAIMNLDLVITIDSSIAHLAGALGKPVWIIMQYPPEWRWLAEGESSYWYNSARLFRRKNSDDIGEIMSKIRDELKKIL